MELPEWWPHDKPYAIMDCLLGMKELPDKCVDLILTDPPYGTTNLEWDTLNQLPNMLIEMNRISKAQILFCSVKSLYEIGSNLEFKYEMVWDKVTVSNIANAKKQPLRSHELIALCGKLEYYPLKTGKSLKPFSDKRTDISDRTESLKTVGAMGKEFDVGVGYPKTIITSMRPNNLTGGGFHPTQKPLDLMEWFCNNYSKKGALILDPFLGSGTTLLACRKTNRIGLGFEINPDYEPIIRKRSLQDIKPLEEYF